MTDPGRDRLEPVPPSRWIALRVLLALVALAAGVAAVVIVVELVRGAL